MNECKKIGSLIHLYRTGELSAGDTKLVLEHTGGCSNCREIIRQLYSIDAALVTLRKNVPEFSENSDVVDKTIARIVEMNSYTGGREEKGLNLDGIFGWLRPVLSVAVLAAALLFVIQQSRDAQRVSGLEIHLRTLGNTAGAEVSYTDADAKRAIDAVSSEGNKEFSSFHALRSAGIGLGSMRMIGSEIFELFRNKNRIFDDLSARYPNLSKVTLEDGIDNRERKILDTEGRAFLKEFEQLLREGDK